MGRSPEVVRIELDADGELDAQPLVKFAVNARIDLLATRTLDASGQWRPVKKEHDFNRTAMANHLGLRNAGQLSNVAGPARPISTRDVRDLEHRLMVFAYRHRSLDATAVRGLGWLTAFAQELLPREDDASASTNLERWLGDLCRAGPTSSAEALVLGECLLGLLSGASAADAEAVWHQHQRDAVRTARGLVAVSTRPPGSASLAATHIAARLGPRVLPIVREHVLSSPVGFRTMRIVTRMLQLITRHRRAALAMRDGVEGAKRHHRSDQQRGAEGNGAELRPRAHVPRWWSRDGAVEEREITEFLSSLPAPALLPDPYPGRSQYLEAVRGAIDVGRLGGDRSWASERGPHILQERLDDQSRPRRERAYAAWCCLALGLRSADEVRALAHHTPDRVWAYLAELQETAAHAGVATTALLLDPPEHGDGPAEVDLVRAVSERARPSPAGRPFLKQLPASVAGATAQLLRVALLSPDGLARGRACEALRESGVTNEASAIVAALLADDACPSWLAEIAAFSLGQLADPHGVTALETVAGAPERPAPERHAAFFSLGDLRWFRASVIELAAEVLTGPPPPTAPGTDVRHAAAYAVAVLRPNDLDRTARERQRDLLDYLANPYSQGVDRLTRALAHWGLASFDRVDGRDALTEQALVWGVDERDLDVIAAV